MAKSSTSFEKGNQAGSATRFAPGQTGNADGRPKWRPITEAIKAALQLKIAERLSADALAKLPKRLQTATVAELVADRLINEALFGETLVRACREIMDRVEGRVPLPLIGSSDDPVTITIVSNIPRPDRSKKKPAKVPKNVQ